MSDWTKGEIEVVTAAVRAAPSVHNTQPWVLEFHDDGAHGVSLYQRLDRALERHDPLGRDLLISCGAALENLLLAIRVLGWVPALALVPGDRPDLVGRARVTGRREPSDVELRRYAAVSRRRSYRQPFTSAPIEQSTRDALVAASDTGGVEVRAVRGDGDIDVIARVFDHAALVLKADRAYQRELSAWTTTSADPRPGEGVASVPRHLDTLPWAGLVRRLTAVPDPVVFADRLRRECLLVVLTPDDGPLDHVRAGMAVQATWLDATGRGLVGSILTQPLQLRGVRAGLIEGMELAGFPQALMRFGHPAEPHHPKTEFAALRDGAKEDPS
ncbi:MAG TPA: nitroreductase [Actinophytocola sp.]|jgi:hypothetical protein|uniref:Acg family FMN-binding oxidoreductase n=1 Tax=Actinophytocola sp. TaxID=1872138 RepID=UPI002F936DAB